jgi:hypothetical protein
MVKDQKTETKAEIETEIKLNHYGKPISKLNNIEVLNQEYKGFPFTSLRNKGNWKEQFNFPPDKKDQLINELIKLKENDNKIVLTKGSGKFLKEAKASITKFESKLYLKLGWFINEEYTGKGIMTYKDNIPEIIRDLKDSKE